MTHRLPERFEKMTRWAYVDEKGVELGPFSASEMIKLIEERTVNPNTTVVEMTSRKTSSVMDVKPFADVVMSLVEQTRKVRAEKDFEKAKQEASTTYTAGSFAKVALFGGLVLVLAGAAYFGTSFFRTKKKDDGADKQAAKEEAMVPAPAAPKKAEDVYQILEADVLSVEESEGNRKLAEKVMGESKMAPSTNSVTGQKKKLEGGGGKKQAKKGPGRPKANGGPAGAATGLSPGAGAAAEEESIQEMDFSEDEAEGSGSGSGADTALARSRLRKVVEGCGRRVMSQYPDMTAWHVEVSATLTSTGQIKGLRFTADPASHVGELKLCANADLPGQRVPEFEGADVPLSVSLDL
jgi:hypothetical protein